MNKTVALSSADLPRSFANAERIELLDEVLERREDLDEAELCDLFSNWSSIFCFA